MTQFDGPKRKGRFLKGKSRVLSKVALSDFAFRPLEEQINITPDNAVRNIIHSKYHEKEELAAGVTIPRSFDEDLVPAHQHRAVIFPLDFTKDWERNRKLSKDRAMHRDDEDYDLEQSLGTSHPDEDEEAHAQAALRAQAAAQQQVRDAKVPDTVAVRAAFDGPIEKAPYSSMDAVSQAIKSLRPGADGFIPNAAPPSASDVTTTTHVPVDPEQQASETYKQRVAERQIDEAAVQQAFDEAAAKGFKEGYDKGYTGGFKDGHSQGEEKAEIAARQHANALFGKVGELIQEFAGLKHEILDNVQENFYELAQAMAEALLQREFSIRPDAFVAVLRKAISEAVEPGKFRIKVHPDTYAHVEAVAPADIKEALLKDPTLEPGDFRIESQLSVVDVNIRSMLKELLDQADISLFDENARGEKAS